jgi:hypothetical protein
MPEERKVNKECKWKPMLRRPLGRPKNRWVAPKEEEEEEEEDKEEEENYHYLL